MAIKLVALDIDGTLTSTSKEISERNMKAVADAVDAGVCVIVATGRGCFATRPIWKALDLHGPSILYGGALTMDIDTEKPVHMHALDPKLIHEVLDFSAELGIHAQIYVNDVVIYEKPSRLADLYVQKHSLPHKTDPDLRRKDYSNVPKILAFSEIECQDEILEAYRERFRGLAQVSRSLPGYIEINCLNTTKGSALADLSRSLGISRAEVAAVGDNYLDQDMIEWAGLGACVSDGAELVKAAADVVVPACDDDGVAYFIDRYVLNG
jgi:Cof subfamily protein (haloacid dehalogenase superfamily)